MPRVINNPDFTLTLNLTLTLTLTSGMVAPVEKLVRGIREVLPEGEG